MYDDHGVDSSADAEHLGLARTVGMAVERVAAVLAADGNHAELTAAVDRPRD